MTALPTYRFSFEILQTSLINSQLEEETPHMCSALRCIINIFCYQMGVQMTYFSEAQNPEFVFVVLLAYRRHCTIVEELYGPLWDKEWREISAVLYIFGMGLKGEMPTSILTG